MLKEPSFLTYECLFLTRTYLDVDAFIVRSVDYFFIFKLKLRYLAIYNTA